MTPVGARSRFLASLVAAFILTVIILNVFVSELDLLEINGAALMLGHGIAAVFLIRYGLTSENPDARAFMRMGFGAAFGSAGVLAVGIASNFVVVPAFGPLDALFIAGYGAYLWGIVSFPTVRRSWRSQVRIILDGAVGAISVGVLLWDTVVSSILQELSGLSLTQRAIGTVYPLLDVAMLVGIMILFLRRGSHRFDIRLVVLSVGFAVQAIGDLGYLSSVDLGSFNQSTPNMIPFLASALVAVVAALLVTRSPSPMEIADRSAPLWSYVLPYATSTAMVAYHLYLSLSGYPESNLLELAPVVVMILVIARQSLAIHENRTKVEQERRSLIASVSHELRTPLTSMIGFLSIMKEAGDELSAEEREELSDVVLEQANYMGRMVTDIILLARETPDKLVLLETVHPIRELVSSILDTLGEKAETVEASFDPSIETSVDFDRVRQLVTNLLTNAIRYGADRAEVRFEAQGRDLSIEVHDDGPGVPRKYQDAVWERFERGSHQLNSMVPGTGLGLAIVEMIAKAHGGTASYRTSEILGGACFSVILPDRVVSFADRTEAVRVASQPASVRSR